MKKDEFLKRLELLLSDISEEERQEAIAFYRSYFEEAGEENEADIIKELESPEKVAGIIKRDLGMIMVREETSSFEQDKMYDETHREKNDEKKRNVFIIALVVMIGILTSPALLGVLFGIIGTIFGVSIAAVAVTFALFVVGFVFAGLGIGMAAEVSMAVGLVFTGAGMLVLAIAILAMLVISVIFGTFFPWLWKEIRNLCKKLFSKKGAQAA